MNAKKLSIFGGILVVLIGLLVVLNNMNKTVYGVSESKLYPATRELLDDPNYQNLIMPKELDQKIKDKESFFVYYFASDCPHCRYTTPLLKPVADEMGINLHMFNLREFQNYFNKMNIEATPTLVHYKDGVDNGRLKGGLAEPGTTGYSIDDFRAFFEQHKPEGNM